MRRGFLNKRGSAEKSARNDEQQQISMGPPGTDSTRDSPGQRSKPLPSSAAAGTTAGLQSSLEFLKTLSPEDALRRTQIGGTLLCFDYPVGGMFSIDVVQWTVGKQFQGLKMLNPGQLHLLHYCPTPRNTSGVKTGMFVKFSTGQVQALRWSETEEVLMHVPEEERKNLEKGVRSFAFDTGLGVHTWGSPASNLWMKLSQYVCDETLQRCGIRVNASIFPGTAPEKQQGDASGGSVDDGCYPTFTSLAVQRPQGLSAAEISQWHLDKSRWLDVALEKKFRPNDLAKSSQRLKVSKHSLAADLEACEAVFLGEFQLSFLLLHYLELQPGLEQWKSLIAHIGDCQNAVARRPALFSELLAAMRVQLRLVPEDFFVSDLSSGSFLEPALRSLLDNCHLALDQWKDTASTTESVGVKVKTSLQVRVTKLETFLASRFIGWSYEGYIDCDTEVAATEDLIELFEAMGEDAPALAASSSPVRSTSVTLDTSESPARARMDWMLPPQDSADK